MTVQPLTLTIELTADQIEAIAQRAAIVAATSVGQSQPEPWITVDQAAEYLACRRQRIYNLVSQRRVRHVKDGTRVLFRRQWLDDILETSAPDTPRP